METKLDDDSRSGRVALAKVGLSALLACLCKLVEFGRVGIPDIRQVPVADYRGLLVLAVGALAFRAHQRHGYGPCMLGLLAAAVVLVAKFWWESNSAMYAAIGLLLIASMWSVWPQRLAVPDCCAEKQINQRRKLGKENRSV